MGRRPLKTEEVAEIETKVAKVLDDVKLTEGELDVNAMFAEIMFTKTETAEDAYVKIREMSRRFGPRLMQLLGCPPAPGACKIRVTENKMAAELDIEPSAGEGLPVSLEDVREEMAKQQIVYGIDEKEIGRAVDAGRLTPVRGVRIASGTPVENGRDGYIEILKDSGPAPAAAGPTMGVHIQAMEIDTVNKDQKIAKIVLPTEGTAGKDILGCDVLPQAGKHVVPSAGAEVSYDANAGLFYAKSAGRVLVHDHFVDIEKMLAFGSDIDISVGHVQFPGEILVRGWIRSGLSVQAENDIAIEGGVEAALVKSSSGSICIRKGVQGSGLAIIEAAWDITAKFVEQAAVMAGGVLKVQSAVRSELAAGEAVIVRGGKGTVIGGAVFAGERVEVRELGAGTGRQTEVRLGITPDILRKLSTLKTRRQAAQKALGEIEQTLAKFGLTEEALKAGALTDEGRKILQLTKTAIVLQDRLNAITAEESKFLETMKTNTDGVLDVRGRVYPDVRIHIGPATYIVTEPMSFVRFKYDCDARRIKLIPLV